MQTLRPRYSTWPLATAVITATLLSACAGAPKQTPVQQGVVSTDRETSKALGAPVVHVSTEQEYSSFRSVRTRLRVEDDAYVLVVNVTPDGMAQIIFPESPRDDGLLEGGKAYSLPHFFGGYPSLQLQTATSNTQFVMVRRSAEASALTEGPGYVFVLASKKPFNMRRLEEEGYFDWVEVGRTLWELESNAVIPGVAEAALADGRTFVASADVARYAGYHRYTPARTTYAMRNSLCYDAAWSPAWMPSDPWGLSNNGCALDALRHRRTLLDLVDPPRPIPPAKPDSTAGDSTATDSTSMPSPQRRPTVRHAAERTNAFMPRRGEVELNSAARQQMLRQDRFEAVRNGRETLVERERRESAQTRRSAGDIGNEMQPRTWERPSHGARASSGDGAGTPTQQPAQASHPKPMPERTEAPTPSRASEPASPAPRPARPQADQPVRTDRVDHR